MVIWLIVLLLLVVGIVSYFYINSWPILTAWDNFYDLQIQLLDWTNLSFADFRGKKVLIVNIASMCGLVGQLSDLQKLYTMYQDKLIVLWVPSNQFLGQEPKDNAEIATFCQRNYGVTFLIAAKTFVRWKQQHPVYQWLTHKELNHIQDSTVMRNYQKYLISEQWILLGVFSPQTLPFDTQLLTMLVS